MEIFFINIQISDIYSSSKQVLINIYEYLGDYILISSKICDNNQRYITRQKLLLC